MNFKRPSFKKGGSTGIDQLTPRKKFQFGTSGFQFLEPGLQNELRNAYRPTRNIGTKTITRQNIPTGGLRKGNIGSRLLTQLRKAAIPSAKGAGLAAGYGGILSAIPVGLAYMNRPRTLEEKKVMQEYGPIDETFFQYDEYDADRKKARGIGEEISFTDALFMNPETGKYPKAFGRTKDREEIEKLFGTDAGFLPNAGPKEVNIEEIVDTMVPNKKTGTKDDDTPKEPSFEDTFEKEKSRIERLIGEDDNKGIVAIALSDAIGTPGTIADKAAVLNKALLGIMVGKKKDKKDIAKLAYTATKELEKAKLAAGKEGFSEKQFKEMAKLRRIITDTTGAYNDAEKAEASARYKNQTEVLKAIGGKSTAEKVMKPGDAREQIKRFKDGAKKLAKMDKNDPGYGAALNEYMAEIEFLSNYPELMPSIRRIDAIYANVLGENKKDGGRIGFANDTPMEESIQVSETVGQGQVPTAQTSQLSFEEIRNRLPKEITDDVVRLIAGSNEALQDFSYIRTQGDVDKFNMKYGVTLVLPQSTA